MMACQNGPFGHVNGVWSVEFPNGNACEAWEKLVSTYDSDNMASTIALSRVWTKCTLRENKSPDICKLRYFPTSSSTKKFVPAILIARSCNPTPATMDAHAVFSWLLADATRHIPVSVRSRNTEYQYLVDLLVADHHWS